MSIQQAIAEGYAQILAEGRENNRRIVEEHLDGGETLLAFYRAKKSIPFLLKVLPFKIGEILERILEKHFVIAITDRRLLVVQELQTFLMQKTRGSRLLAGILLGGVESIVPDAGLFKSSLTIRSKDGRTFSYNMIQANSFADDFELTRRAAAKAESAKLTAEGAQPQPGDWRAEAKNIARTLVQTQFQLGAEEAVARQVRQGVEEAIAEFRQMKSQKPKSNSTSGTAKPALTANAMPGSSKPQTTVPASAANGHPQKRQKEKATAITLKCPGCKKKYQSKSEIRQGRIPCPACGAALEIVGTNSRALMAAST
jgi:hypothetical protein